MNTIPVIILNYNSSSDCRKCISFLKKQEGVELEIIVVDNASPRPGERDAIEKLCKQEGCTFIEAKENRGYNAGNNVGLRYAAGKGYKYALIANPDMEFPQENYVVSLVNKMKEEEDIVVCGSDIVNPEGIHQNPMMRDGDWRSSSGWLSGLFRRQAADQYDFSDRYGESHYCAKVSGCCLMVQVDFIRSLGWFDEKVLLYCEEAILSRQVERKQKKMYYLAEAQAVHAHVKSTKGDPVLRFKLWQKSRVYFIRKYSGDSWWGKWVARCSMKLYVQLFILMQKIRKRKA